MIFFSISPSDMPKEAGRFFYFLPNNLLHHIPINIRRSEISPGMTKG